MATLLLQAAGAAVGSLFGPLGTIIGRAVGGLAGYTVDQALFGTHAQGARLSDLTPQTSTEGTPIPRLYGRARISGQVIWATNYEEASSTSGGKGGLGGGTTTYSYYANFAIGLCAGPIAHIGRVWADGQPIDLSSVTARIYNGTAAQGTDSLIEAKQGDTPAYRDTAIVVFERLPLADFGNRIPQLSFEILKPVAGIERDIRAVTLIPGATEFGYSPTVVNETASPGSSTPANRHIDGSTSDWQAALDDLQATCPNLERVALVVAWFGNDLRAAHATLMPGVVDRTTEDTPAWSAAGLTRTTARLVTTYNGKPAFGGTPSDASVIAAIADLRARGLKVTFYPFIMMDVAAGNGLGDPYGGSEQAAYPWRGSITLSVAPGRGGTPDKTSAAATEIATFVGTAAAGDFSVHDGAVHYSGPDEWTFRRFVLHCANLAKAAGGVDAFLLGSELRGLTTARSAAATYPFVSALVSLAAEVKTTLGTGAKVSYGADWSEYFGHHPADGSGDVTFHLDPLWSSSSIDFVGIDNYMPLSDWRDGDDHLDAANWDSGRDTAYLVANVAGGEGYGWYYATGADRDAQTRTPITDGAGKPWVFRYKDLKSWWSNAHHDRPGGIEATTATAWVAQSKPIWFTEIGCPAVDKGANQPNVFPDPKSSAGGLPYYSSGLGDDLMQRRFVGAVLGYWNPASELYMADANPTSTVYGAPMVALDAIHWWTWDARPYPAFPLLTDVWSDGANWETGHWLNGRLGAVSADALVRTVFGDYGVPAEGVDDLDGVIDGFLISDTSSARDALEPLSNLLFFEAFESGDAVKVVRRGRRASATFTSDDFVEESGKSILTITRAQETELPAEIAISFSDVLADYRASSVSSRRLAGGSTRVTTTDTGAIMSYATASGLADTALQDAWAGRETFTLALPQRALALEPADVVLIDVAGDTRTVLVTKVEDAGLRRIEARSIEPDILAAVPAAARVTAPKAAPLVAAPEVMLLNLPLLTGTEAGYAPHVAVFASPWPGTVALSLGSTDSGFALRQTIDRRAVMGELTASLAAGPLYRWDGADAIDVRLYGGGIAGQPELSVLNGANVAAIGTADGGFEVIQFETATLTGANLWRLSGLLRGQAGTGDVMAAGHDVGARFVLLDAAVVSLNVSEAESGLGLTLRCGAAGAVYDPDTFTDVGLGPARRGLMCLPPVHVTATRDPTSNDIAIQWIRQTRIGGDSWDPVEVPLGETSEAYDVAIGNGTTVFRTLNVAAPAATYAAADQASDFGGVPSVIHLSISQASPTEGPGLAAVGAFNV